MNTSLPSYIPVHYRVSLILCCLTLLSSLSFGQNNKYPVIRTPQNVAVNTKLPKNRLSNLELIPVSFSKVPADNEIYAVNFFEEPLVPADGNRIDEENKSLVRALIGYSQRKTSDDFTSLTGFLNKYPQSRWQGALWADMGVVYRRTGYYNLAMEAWQKSWNVLKDIKEPKVKVLADKVLSELLLINAWVGRTDAMESLLDEVKYRTIEGPAVERVASARRCVWIMRNRPGISFKCGPYALNTICARRDTANKDTVKSYFQKLMDVQSTPKGFSLTQLQRMSEDVGIKYQMAYRTAGAPVIFNSVVHWKLNHYSAFIQEDSIYYKCQDATMGTVYGQEFWLTHAALDSSASGYFLVPEGALPAGWRKVEAQEGDTVYGRGNEIPDQGKHVSDADQQLPDSPPPTDPPNTTCSSSHPPMAQSNIHASAVSLHIYDRPVYYTPPVGPSMFWNVDYHQKDTYQPANFTFSNMGPKWTFNWLSFVKDNPKSTTSNVDLYVMGGGDRTFSYNTTTKTFNPEIQTSDVLVRTCPNCYELHHPDGSKEVYAQSDGNVNSGRRIFLTKKVDAAGNELSLFYDLSLRLTALSDAVGQVTTIRYDNADTFKVTQVIDPFGRSASFQYDGSGKLSKITDMIGIVSSFQYNSGDFITAMTTPYGTTSFTYKDSANIKTLDTHYPLDEAERVEYRENAPGISSTDSVVPKGVGTNIYLVYRNTFYWDKKAMKTAPGDYTKAKLYHWLHGSSTTGENGTVAPFLESEKSALENRVWYGYDKQSTSYYAYQGMSAKPIKIGRVLDDGTTQLYQYTYNDIGAVLTSIDPLNRKFTYLYDTNKIDLLEVRQTKNNANELLSQFTYNSQHLPLTSKDASGLITTYKYNTAGQLLTVTNPKNETTTLSYDSKGYLKTIIGPIAGSQVSFTYDGYGRVRTVTDPEGYTLTTDYDVLDRPTLIIYPDSTYEQIVYNRLDAVHQRDRMGRWSHNIYDSLRRETAAIDALGRITQFIWCSCGSLSEIIDPLKNITSFVRDIQGRVQTKTFADGKSINYRYENTTSRLKETTDAKGQKKSFTYYLDDNLNTVSYSNTTVATSPVSYTYDTTYNRVKTMTDGTGVTTYGYKAVGSGLGSGMLSSEDGPLSNDLITYGYDSLERISSRSINGMALSVTYDPLGRITSETNALGAFGYSYLSQTQRLSLMTYPNGQITSYDYFDNHGDQLLKQIWNQKSGGVTLSKFGYEYNKEEQITKWTQQTNSNVYYNLEYDLDDQLTSATLTDQSTASIVKRYAYQYDKAGNRTSEQIDNTVTSAVYNNTNQLTQRYNNGPMQFKGAVSESASVLVKNSTASDSAMAAIDSATNTFSAFVRTVPGANNISITATDYSGNNNTTLSPYTITVGTGANDVRTFDDNGNTLTQTNPAVTYAWDAEDRLVKITKGANTTEFIYDGLSRRVAEKLNGTVIKQWLWCGTELCEERDATGGTVTKRFFTQGEQIGGVNYYFTKDHLGSVIEMTDASGAMKARYSYDPYGRRTKVSGSIDADFGFTGHYYHTTSGLYLTLYRAYDASAGRWLNRDPIEEKGGINLYGYCLNKPISSFDPLGLDIFTVNRKIGGDNAESRSPLNLYSHTFVVTTKSDGSINHTYSWGNEAFTHWPPKDGWYRDRPEDRKAAREALDKGLAEYSGSFDDFVDQAYNALNKPENKHNWLPGSQCKTEKDNLLDNAKRMYDNQYPNRNVTWGDIFKGR